MCSSSSSQMMSWVRAATWVGVRATPTLRSSPWAWAAAASMSPRIWSASEL
ncbi:MAG: hypothetical protein KH208_13540 [Desulfovibrio sp.]|uniref:hypothetical protein n=1 Tax=Desulfovibrio sp. TaxID=885 RepID=UPI00345B6737|nr:hypothetical protein [Desulfovibrio sp.]